MMKLGETGHSVLAALVLGPWVLHEPPSEEGPGGVYRGGPSVYVLA